jgi:hypothetical protein
MSSPRVVGWRAHVLVVGDFVGDRRRWSRVYGREANARQWVESHRVHHKPENFCCCVTPIYADAPATPE